MAKSKKPAELSSHSLQRAQHNPVAKYAKQFNKSHTFKDKKRAAKAGYRKHSKQEYLIKLLHSISIFIK